MNLDEAVRYVRSNTAYSDLVRDAYLGRDVIASAQRFAKSAEFAAVLSLLADDLTDADILDLGAGTGIASFALLHAGARKVYALEPDASDEVGRGAIRRLPPDSRLEVLEAVGEQIPLPDASVDVVYTRQVLHHILDLPRALKECARVLKPGGVFLACREHVVDDAAQLKAFLDAHPIHQLAGGENAYPLDGYISAIQDSGIVIEQIVEPWSSVINAFPRVQSDAELRTLAQRSLRRRLGPLGTLASAIPAVRKLAWWRLTRPVPGRMYSFFGRKCRT